MPRTKRFGFVPLILASGLTLASAPAASAKDTLIEANVLAQLHPVKATKVPVTDFHIRLNNPSGFNNLVVKPVADGFPTIVPTPTPPLPPGTTTLDLDFSGAEFGTGRSPGFVIDFKSKTNTIRIKDAYWTNNDQNVGKVEFAGMTVKDDPIFTLHNDFDTPIGVRGLQFLVDVPRLVNFGELLPGAYGGFGPTYADFVIPALGSISFDLPTIQRDNYVFAQGLFYSPEDGEATSLFLYGHQQPGVPEPATWAMMILGFGLAATALRRRGRQAIAPAARPATPE